MPIATVVPFNDHLRPHIPIKYAGEILVQVAGSRSLIPVTGLSLLPSFDALVMLPHSPQEIEAAGLVVANNNNSRRFS
jgi:hypothetical protein